MTVPSPILVFLLVTTNSSLTDHPDVIYRNGNIWTGVRGASRAQALAVKGERIVAVGSDSEVGDLRGPHTRMVDLSGHFVAPGFVDGHTHFIWGGIQLASIDLRKSDSPADFIKTIRDYSDTLPEGRWITGGRWDHERWGGELPRRSWIDSVTTRTPVFVLRVDGHMGLANSNALELAGITNTTPDPPGGLIVRDGSSGDPTGILKDEAMLLVDSVIPEPSEDELDEALTRAMDFAISQGITQVHDMSLWRDLETYRRAEEKGDLQIRIYAIMWHSEWERLAREVQRKGRGDDWLRWGGVKAILDGSLGSRTAWMHEPYLDDPTTRGIVVSADTIRLREVLDRADEAGLQLAVHAIGDRANDWLLETYGRLSRENGSRNRRFRIEHAQHLTEEAIHRFSPLGVIPSMQPFHCIDDGRWAGKRVTPRVLRNSYAFRALLDAGAILAFGSDWPVASLSPLKGIYAAVTRRTLDGKNPDGWYPEQKITVEEALRAYTWGNAFASFQEHKMGTLEVGKLADFVVLSDDILTLDPVHLLQVDVLRTVVGGLDRYVGED